MYPSNCTGTINSVNGTVLLTCVPDTTQTLVPIVVYSSTSTPVYVHDSGGTNFGISIIIFILILAMLGFFFNYPLRRSRI